MTNIVKKGDICRLILCGESKEAVYDEEIAIATSGCDTNTVVLSAPAISDVEDFVGCVLECIYSPSYPGNLGLRRLVKECDGSDTLEIDAFPNTVTSGDKFRIVSLDIAMFVDDTGGSSTIVQDADRTEADDYFNNAYLVAVASDNVAKQYQCSDFSGGDATVTGLEGNTAEGDLFMPVLYFSGNASVKVDTPSHLLEQMTGELGIVKKVPGQLRDAVVSLSDVKIQGAGSTPAAAYAPGRSFVHYLLAAGLTERTVVNAQAIAAASTTTQINLTSVGDYRVNDIVIINNRARYIDSITTGPPAYITITPALPAAPAEGDVCIVPRQYYPRLGTTVGRIGCEVSSGDRESIIVGGGMFSPVLAGARNQLVLMSGDIQGGYCFDRPTISYPCHAVETTGYVSGDRTWLWIDGTSYYIRDWKLDYALQFSKQQSKYHPNQQYAYQLVDAQPVLTITALLNDTSYARKLEGLSGKEFECFLECGDIAGNPGKLAMIMESAYFDSCELSESDSIYHVQMTIKPRSLYDYANSRSKFNLGVL